MMLSKKVGVGLIKVALLLLFSVVVVRAFTGSMAVSSAEVMAEETAVSAPLGTPFTYQGELTENGELVSGSYDFQFILYDAAVGGAQVGGILTVADLAVANGLFTAELDFGNEFTGSALWLEISVRAGSSTSTYATLQPRQPLTAAPYALGLRPGAVITGTLVEPALTLSNGGGDGVTVYDAGGAANHFTSTGVAGLRVAGSAGSGLHIGYVANDGIHIVESGLEGVDVENAARDGFEVDNAAQDGLHIGTVGSDGVHVEDATSAGLRVNNAGTFGIRINNATVHGLHVDNAGQHGLSVSNAAESGLYIDQAGHNGLEIGTAQGAAVSVLSAGGSGVTLYSVDLHGLWVNSAGASGVAVNSAGSKGLFIGSTGAEGVYVDRADDDGFTVCRAGAVTCTGTDYENVNGLDVGTAEDYGARVLNAGRAGFRIDNPGTNGFYAYDAGDSGVWIRTASNWAGYFGGNINVTGSCTGCIIATFGINNSQVNLQPGDIVTSVGISPGQVDNAQMLLQLQPATAGQPLVGVVAGRAELHTSGEDGSTVLVPREGTALPGDFVSLIIYGPVPVKANTTFNIGDRVTVSEEGQLRALQRVEVNGVQLAEAAPSLGMTLEAEDGDGDGLVWVLVNPQ